MILGGFGVSGSTSMTLLFFQSEIKKVPEPVFEIPSGLSLCSSVRSNSIANCPTSVMLKTRLPSESVKNIL